MKRFILFLTVVSAIFLIHSCSKELSLEGIGSTAQSAGSLQKETAGDCLPKTVKGTYEVGTILVPASNYIEIQVNVTATGSYQISTEIAAGISFSSTGNFNSTGIKTVQLKGTGTPSTAGTRQFTVTYNGTSCKVNVDILPTGGALPATFDLKGTTGACDAFALSGAYATGIVLNSAANNVKLKVNVKTIGTYNISTIAVNGIIFSGSGALPVTGDATITLTASGTPGAAGAVSIPVTAGSSTCSFPLTVTGAAQFAIVCGGAVTAGDLTQGAALGASNTIKIPVNITATGPYTITGSVNGMSYSATGNFSSMGSQTITLTGSGTPTGSGSFMVPLTGGGSNCSVGLTVNGGTPVSDMVWQLKDGSITIGGPTTSAGLGTIAGIEILSISGETASGDSVLKISVSKTGTLTTGTYSSKSFPNTTMFNILDSNNPGFVYIATVGQGDLNINITKLDRTNKIVQGTFSGKAMKSGASVSVSGSFKAELN